MFQNNKLIGVMTLAVVCLTSPALGARIWEGDVSSDWNTAGNWNPSGVPTSSSNLEFDNTASTTTVTLSATGDAKTVTFKSTAPAFTIGGGNQLRLPDSGQIINDSSNDQDLTGLSLLRPASSSNTTVTYRQNTAATTLKLPGITGYHSTFLSKNTRQVFTGNSTGVIEVAKLDDRVIGSGGNTTSVLMNGPVTLKILGDGSFTGAEYSTAAAVTLRNGVVSVASVANSGTDSPLGSDGSIDFGDSTATNATGTLQFTGAGDDETNRSFRIYSGSTGVFDITQAAGNLELTTGITQVTGSGGNVAKTGDGTLTLSGASSYTGATAVNEGTLEVTGSHTGAGAYAVAAAGATLEVALGGVLTLPSGGVTVGSGGILDVDGSLTATGGVSVGGTLSGGGSITADVVVTSALLSPGSSDIGALTINGDLTLDGSAGEYSVYEWEVGGSETDLDLVNVDGTLNLTSWWALKIVGDGYTPPAGDYDLFTYTVDVGTFNQPVYYGPATLPFGWTSDMLSVVDDDAGTVYLHVIPEPNMAALLVSGLLTLLLFARRRRKR